jgi:hypothetical protein
MEAAPNGSQEYDQWLEHTNFREDYRQAALGESGESPSAADLGLRRCRVMLVPQMLGVTLRASYTPGAPTLLSQPFRKVEYCDSPHDEAALPSGRHFHSTAAQRAEPRVGISASSCCEATQRRALRARHRTAACEARSAHGGSEPLRRTRSAASSMRLM